MTSTIEAMIATTSPRESRIGAADVLTSIGEPSRCSAAQVEVADHLALRDAREGREEALELAFGDDRADAADHLFGRPAEDLARGGIPRAHATVDAEVDDRHG